MVKAKAPQKLAKFLGYILERRPDEFGLVLDSQGFVKIKELLKALNEEKGWKHVRRSHLNEILYGIPDPPFEILENRIRAKRRDKLPRPDAAPELPKLLYTCVRRKAYPYVAQKGIFPSGYQQVVLCADRNLAERMGKRSDPQPIILTVHVPASVDQGILFQQVGELIFLAASIPPGCFSGPALPKTRPRPQKQQQPAAVAPPKAAGSFVVDLNNVGSLKNAAARTPKKQPGWKGKKERLKKQKRKRERPPWRK